MLGLYIELIVLLICLMVVMSFGYVHAKIYDTSNNVSSIVTNIGILFISMSIAMALGLEMCKLC